MSRRDSLPPLNPTRAFEATGRLLSVSKAADELCVTPAAVSRQVRALETFLGVSLFERIRGGLELTPAGARYLSDLMPLFSALRESTEGVMAGAPGRSNVLRIRSPATFAVRWLIPRLASFHRLHQDIDVQLTTGSAPLDFRREDIDAGIQLGDGDWPETHSQRLIPNELIPVAAPSRARRKGWKLERETLLHSLARPEDWTLWLKFAGFSTANTNRGMRYETSLLAYQAAVEGHGVAIAQKALVLKELEEGSLVAPFDMTLDRGGHTYYFAWPSHRPESKSLKAFRQWLAKVVR
ncbi:LysR substrate-binding domain-containing protein [Cupriavidus lacunae]|uniref:LysR family transcriptional regulator n=1 Tax=Cupriavidus lacunae TaxID=2666307 RepID=A0A370NJI7_9BURK|nr:LysR substrate-binding domain-containing protein [Cupriavidus lacunae]RDK05736.1 LysR family transcriptional regulator [Cupriavidus lacunae]